MVVGGGSSNAFAHSCSAHENVTCTTLAYYACRAKHATCIDIEAEEVPATRITRALSCRSVAEVCQRNVCDCVTCRGSVRSIA